MLKTDVIFENDPDLLMHVVRSTTIPHHELPPLNKSQIVPKQIPEQTPTFRVTTWDTVDLLNR